MHGKGVVIQPNGQRIDVVFEKGTRVTTAIQMKIPDLPYSSRTEIKK
jgi:hypothetical protein